MLVSRDGFKIFYGGNPGNIRLRKPSGIRNRGIFPEHFKSYRLPLILKKSLWIKTLEKKERCHKA